MIWQVNSGSCIFWWDNWTGKGPIAATIPNTPKSTKSLVKYYTQNVEWNLEKLEELLPNHLVKHIETIDVGRQNLQDKVYWDLIDNEKYNNKSAWKYIRACKPNNPFFYKVWHSSILFKISFLTWRLWLGKLPFDEVITRFGKQIISRCVSVQTQKLSTCLCGRRNY